MIQAGIISAETDCGNPYKATLKVDGIAYGFVVGNHEKIPFADRQALDCGDRVAGIFEFDPQDQFATYINPEDIVQVITNVVEEPKARQQTQEETEACPMTDCPYCKNFKCTSNPMWDCPE